MLSQLHISTLRNITDLTIQPSSGINVILGENGSGKTSVLEAIYLLAMGRSFRARSLKNIIQFGQQKFQVVAKTKTEIPIGLQFDSGTGLQIRLNNAPLKKLSELVAQLPLQMIPANCHQFFEQGPRYRRQILDWGLFHVEPSFNYQWQSYRKIVQQRNSAIRQHKKLAEIQLWDLHLAKHGEAINTNRKQQLDRLLAQFKVIFPLLCPEFKDAVYSLKYQTGWAKDQDLASALQATIERDQQLGYTRSGSHAADWSFKINDIDPANIFSRGQQKLFFLALCMAQARLTVNEKRENSILLIDDLSSELDQQHQEIVLHELAKLPVQSFITSTDLELINTKQLKVFHVKQGQIISTA